MKHTITDANDRSTSEASASNEAISDVVAVTPKSNSATYVLLVLSAGCFLMSLVIANGLYEVWGREEGWGIVGVCIFALVGVAPISLIGTAFAAAALRRSRWISWLLVVLNGLIALCVLVPFIAWVVWMLAGSVYAFFMEL